MCFSYKSLKTSTKLWLKNLKGTQINSVLSKSMAKAIYRHEYRVRNKCKKRI